MAFFTAYIIKKERYYIPIPADIRVTLRKDVLKQVFKQGVRLCSTENQESSGIYGRFV